MPEQAEAIAEAATLASSAPDETLARVLFVFTIMDAMQLVIAGCLLLLAGIGWAAMRGANGRIEIRAARIAAYSLCLFFVTLSASRLTTIAHDSYGAAMLHTTSLTISATCGVVSLFIVGYTILSYFRLEAAKARNRNAG